MKKLNIILILMLFVTMSTAQNKVAVFDPTDDSNTGMAEIVREVLSTGLTNSPNYTPVERVMIQQVLQENKYQATGMVDESKVSELGKQMGADYVCVSIIKKMEPNYFITAKLVNVKTATVELQQFVKTDNGDDDLFDKVIELSEKLFGQNSNSPKNNNLSIIEADFKKYMVMPKDFDTKYFWEDATKVCENLTAYGYDDWILPSIQILSVLYEKKDELGNFEEVQYWSSDSHSLNRAWFFDFQNGKARNDIFLNKFEKFKVRAIRMIE